MTRYNSGKYEEQSSNVSQWRLEQWIEEWKSNVNSSISSTARECSQETLDKLQSAYVKRFGHEYHY